MITIGDQAIGRNSTRVEAVNDGIVFVKTIVGPDADAERRYRNCVAFDQVQATMTGPRLSPALLQRRDDERTLIYPFLHESFSLQDLASEWANDGWQADHLFVQLLPRAAGLLAKVHDLSPPEGSCSVLRQRDGTDEEPLRRLRWLGPDEYANASGGELDCWRLFHHDAQLQGALGQWLANLRRQDNLAVVHGDIRPDQFVIADEQMFLIDWEEFSVGPRSRDVAGVVGAIVFEALNSTFTAPMPGRPDAVVAHRELLERGSEILVAVEPAIHSFISSYVDAGGAPLVLADLGSDVGFYLIERVIGRAMLQARVGASDRAIAGVGRGILLNPVLLGGLVGAGS